MLKMREQRGFDAATCWAFEQRRKQDRLKIEEQEKEMLKMFGMQIKPSRDVTVHLKVMGEY